MTVEAALPAQVGETFSRRLCFDTASIRAFAVSVDDRNPLHHDEAVARAAGYPGIIASGTQLGGIVMAMTATHFAQPTTEGHERSGLGIAFDIRFRAVVLAGEEMLATWTVTALERKDRLDGWIVTLEGGATSARGPLLSGKGTLLLRLGQPR